MEETSNTQSQFSALKREFGRRIKVTLTKDWKFTCYFICLVVCFIILILLQSATARAFA